MQSNGDERNYKLSYNDGQRFRIGTFVFIVIVTIVLLLKNIL